jgi:predicted ribonuclease YlaK
VVSKAKVKNLNNLIRITPATVNQEKIFREYATGKHLLIHGSAGTGKTLISLYLGLNDVLDRVNGFRKLLIIRSCVPARAQGFLPGDPAEKDAIFESPYEYLCSKLSDQQGAYKAFKAMDYIDFKSTSYLRGETFEHSIILVDEVQNFNEGEINTIVTRTGHSSRLIICGDEEQNDLMYLRENSCIDNLVRTVKRMPSFSTIEMNVDDICRDGVVKEWILARQQLAKEANLPRFIREGVGFVKEGVVK